MTDQLQLGWAHVVPGVPPSRKCAQGVVDWCTHVCDSSLLFWLSMARTELGHGSLMCGHFLALLIQV